MSSFYEVRLSDSQDAIFINIDAVPEFAVYEDFIEYKGLKLNRGDFVDALVNSESIVKSLTPEARGLVKENSEEVSEKE